MVTVADLPKENSTSGQGVTFIDFVDRWIFVAMAVFLIVVTLTGFIPDSIMKVGMVETGNRPPFPPVLHLHAIAMGSWLLLLLAQTSLMASGRRQGHKQLGMIAMLLAPAVVVIGVVLVPTMYRQVWDSAHAVPGGADAAGLAAVAIKGNIALLQMQVGVVFATVVVLALRARKHDGATHKRLMVLAPIAAMPAAVDRISWLPNSMPVTPWGPEIYILLIALPLFAWDLYRLGGIQRAYRIWLGLVLPTGVLVILLWNTTWWQAFVPRMMGVN
ncbi:MAG: hypothetical protein ABIM50_10800 [Novosphingobium sp.]